MSRAKVYILGKSIPRRKSGLASSSPNGKDSKEFGEMVNSQRDMKLHCKGIIRDHLSMGKDMERGSFGGKMDNIIQDNG